MTRPQHDPATKAYLARKEAEGKTDPVSPADSLLAAIDDTMPPPPISDTPRIRVHAAPNPMICITSIPQTATSP